MLYVRVLELDELYCFGFGVVNVLYVHICVCIFR